MDEQELSAIRTRSRQAWPGPWEWDEQGGLYSTSAQTEVPFEEAREFIAHARSDIPRLLAEIERLRAENEELKARIEAGSGKREY